MNNSTRLVRPLLHHSSPRIHLRRSLFPQKQNRTLIESAFQPTIQTFTASRTLPYPHDLLYTIIADIGNYSTFLPYCISSTVTKWSRPTLIPSKPTQTNKDSAEGELKEAQKEVQWPEEATLTVGWQNFRESFTSRVYCVPGRVVEAVSGNTVTTLPAEDIGHHTTIAPESKSAESKNELLTHLLTRWTLHPYPYKPPPLPSMSSSARSPKNPARPEEPTTHPAREQTEVSLYLEYAFTNPVYGGMSKAVAPKVADMMVNAFEEQVRGLLR